MDEGILDMEFCTAEQILVRRNGLIRFKTGSANLIHS
jgi:hypothetical protein